jgi:hypothetical protein
MTEHYSHVGREEKVAAAGGVVRLVWLRTPHPNPLPAARGEGEGRDSHDRRGRKRGWARSGERRKAPVWGRVGDQVGEHRIRMIGPVSYDRVSARNGRLCEEGDLNPYFFRNQILSPSTHPITVGSSCSDGALPSTGVMERQAPPHTSGGSGGGAFC